MELLTTMGKFIVLKDFKSKQQIEAYYNSDNELRFIITDGFFTDFPIFYGNGTFAMDMPEKWSDLIKQWCKLYAVTIN